MLRCQLPVASPLSASAVVAGVAAAAGGADPRPRVARRLVERLGVADALLTDSGTSALGLAIRAALEDSDQAVALPAYCCYDVATAADWAGRRVVLYDLDPATLGPPPDALRWDAGAAVGAVVVVHLFGVPVDLRAVRRSARAAGAVLVEDAAQGLGGAFGGGPLGTWGDVSVLSFGRGKGTTGGGGGALLAPTAAGSALLARARARTAAGGVGVGALARLTAQWLLGRPAIYGLPAALPFLGLGETTYRRPTAPRGAARVHAAVLDRTLDLAPRELATRRERAARLADAARRHGWTVPTPPAEAAPAWLRLPVLPPTQLDALALRRGRRLGVMPAYPRALADLPGFGERIANPGDDFAGARLLARRLVTLPTHGQLAESDVTGLEAWLAHPS